MLRFVVLSVGAFGVVTFGQKVLNAKASESKRKGQNFPMDIILKSFNFIKEDLGPWSVKDLTLGLSATFKISEKKPPKPPGRDAEEQSNDKKFLIQSQHWLAHAEAAYSDNPSMWSLQMNIPENAILTARWDSDVHSMRPSYVLSIDSKYNAIVLSVRGTNNIADMLLSSFTKPLNFHGGSVHAGFLHGKEIILNEIESYITRGMQEMKCETQLVLVGHSLGCGITTLLAFDLQTKFSNLKCFGYGPPACLSLDLARKSKTFSTCFLSGHDLVPRFSMANVERLRQNVLNFDWEAAREKYGEDKEWEVIWKGSDIIQKLQSTQNVICDKMNQSRQLTEGEKEKNHSQNGQKMNESQLTPSEKSEPDASAKSKESENEKRKNGLDKIVNLYPPGRIYLLNSEPPGCGKYPKKNSNAPSIRNYGTYPDYDEAKDVVWKMSEVEQEELQEIIVSPWCVTDHMPATVLVGLEYLTRKCVV